MGGGGVHSHCQRIQHVWYRQVPNLPDCVRPAISKVQMNVLKYEKNKGLFTFNYFISFNFKLILTRSHDNNNIQSIFSLTVLTRYSIDNTLCCYLYVVKGSLNVYLGSDTRNKEPQSYHYLA